VLFLLANGHSKQLQWINGERRRFVAAALSQFPI
jgi:hypothetical protein